MHRQKRLCKFVPVRLLAAIVIGCFAYAQVAVAAHEAVYGADVHYHNGKICAISLHGQRHNHMDVPPVTGAVISLQPIFMFRPANEALSCRLVISTHRARAPPAA